MCSRGEALGGRLVAWSAALLAIAWDPDSMEEAVLLATSIREESTSDERRWAGGMAEGELEPLAPDGARMQLAWGHALLLAASLARVAKSGDVLVDGDLRALRAGHLALIGARAASDAGQRVRGWKLDLAHPWKRAVPSPDVTERFTAQTQTTLDATLEMAAMQFTNDELSTAEVLEIVEATASVGPASLQATPPVSKRRGNEIAERIRLLAEVDLRGESVEALAHLRRARADAENGSVAAKCQAALALAMALTLAGRTEEALLEALDAMARARELRDERAVGACLALLAKLFASSGRTNEAAALREAAGVS